jgi:hypothetical protein
MRINGKNAAARVMPYLVAIIVFAAVSLFYFAPQMEGKVLQMHDIVQYDGMSKESEDHIKTYGEDPQWTGGMFSGMPTVLINMRFDNSQIIKSAYPLLEFMGRPASLIFLAMLSFFVMLVLFGLNPWTGIVTALAYGLSTYFLIIIGAGHITKMIALAYAPLMVGGMYYTLRSNVLLGSALTALFASLEIAANHPQITYYFVLVMAALWINELIRAIKEKWLPKFAYATGMLALAAVLALGSNFAPLWYINEYSKESTRGGTELTATNPAANDKGLDLQYATQWSYGKTESFNMFIPDLMGGSSEGSFSDDGAVAQSLIPYGARNMATQLPSYWGDQPMTAGPTYIGAVVIFLFVLGLFLMKRRTTLWVVIVSVIALFLSWGSNFMWFTELFFNYMPGYDKFRTVSMILVILEWSIPFVAALMLHKLWKEGIDRAEVRKGIFRAAAVTGGIALLFALLGGAMFDFVAPYDTQLGLPDDVLAAMRSERASLLRADAWRSLIYVALTAGAVWLFTADKIKKGVLVAILAVLVCADLITVDLRYMPRGKFVAQREAKITPSEADMQIMQDKEPGYRVLNMSVSIFNDATTSYFHRSIGGYHGAKMQRYQDLIEHYLNDISSPVYNMLNMKYVIDRDGKTVHENHDANGAAWFVDEVIGVDTPDEEIAELGKIDNKHVAVADRRFATDFEGKPTGGDPLATISLVDYKPNHLTYEYDSATDQIAVFSEIYYGKGWQAYVDGAPAPHFRADYVLRAMALPAGSHTVEFRFAAANFRTVSAITLIFSIAILLFVIAAAAWAIYTHRKTNNHAESEEA